MDIAAEKLICAERGNQKIAVEVKSFIKASTISEFHSALGQLINVNDITVSNVNGKQCERQFDDLTGSVL